MSAHASVSIVLTTYNLGAHLARCVSGLIGQTDLRARAQVIVADDGSTDGSLETVERLRARFDLLVLRRPHDGYRLASLKNWACAQSLADVILLLDGDMIPMPNWVNAHLDTLALFPDLTVSIGAREFVDASGLGAEEVLHAPDRVAALPRIASQSNWGAAVDRRLKELGALDGHPAPFHLLHGCNAGLPARLFRAAGGFDEVFDGHWGYEDTELAFRLCQAGAHFAWATAATAFHQENLVLSQDERAAHDLVNFEIACARIPGFREFKSRLNAAGREPWWRSERLNPI